MNRKDHNEACSGCAKRRINAKYLQTHPESPLAQHAEHPLSGNSALTYGCLARQIPPQPSPFGHECSSPTLDQIISTTSARFPPRPSSSEHERSSPTSAMSIRGPDRSSVPQPCSFERKRSFPTLTVSTRAQLFVTTSTVVSSANIRFLL